MKLWIAFLLLALPAANLFSLVQLVSEDGWSIKLGIDKIQAEKYPLIFTFFNEKQTNIEFIIDRVGLTNFKYNLADGGYQFALYDKDKFLLESGKFEVKTPFEAGIKSSGSDQVELELNPFLPLKEVYAAITLDGKPVYQTNFVVDLKKIYTINHLQASQFYQIALSANGYRKILECKTKMENVALNKPISGTFTRLPESHFVDDTTPAILRVNDGRIEWYRGMAVSEGVNEKDQIVIIDLKTNAGLKMVRVTWHAKYYPYQYSIISSLDGKKWDSITRGQKDFVFGIAPDNTPIAIDEYKGLIRANYIGLLVKKGQEIKSGLALRNYLELLELEAYE